MILANGDLKLVLRFYGVRKNHRGRMRFSKWVIDSLVHLWHYIDSQFRSCIMDRLCYWWSLPVRNLAEDWAKVSKIPKWWRWISKGSRAILWHCKRLISRLPKWILWIAKETQRITQKPNELSFAFNRLSTLSAKVSSWQLEQIKSKIYCEFELWLYNGSSVELTLDLPPKNVFIPEL